MIFPNIKLDAAPEIGQTKLLPGELYAQARDLRTNALVGAEAIIPQGDTARLGELNVQFVRETRFAVLQVASNPGIPILFAASFLGVLGLVLGVAVHSLGALTEQPGATVTFADLSLSDLRQKLRESPIGTEMTLTVQSGGETRTLPLILRELYPIPPPCASGCGGLASS